MNQDDTHEITLLIFEKSVYINSLTSTKKYIIWTEENLLKDPVLYH